MERVNTIMCLFLLHETTATTEQTSGKGMANMLKMGSCRSILPVTVKLSLRGAWPNAAVQLASWMMGMALMYLLLQCVTETDKCIKKLKCNELPSLPAGNLP